ncbi:hypothetical protein, partial [Bacteroides faecis]|uniref:hypothetical protein n=1 Tax=Bacteroides faecis TaxID=674529 RepID=UPI00300FA0E8|nr:hypothetical protein [Bacteroides faecis]
KNGICSVQDAVQFIDFINTCHQIHTAMYPTSIDGSIFFLVLLVLFINISKNLVAFVSKAGAKIRDFILTAKRFRKFFF